MIARGHRDRHRRAGDEPLDRGELVIAGRLGEVADEHEPEDRLTQSSRGLDALAQALDDPLKVERIGLNVADKGELKALWTGQPPAKLQLLTGPHLEVETAAQHLLRRWPQLDTASGRTEA